MANQNEMTFKEVAAYYGISKQAIHKWCSPEQGCPSKTEWHGKRKQKVLNLELVKAWLNSERKRKG